LSDVRRNFGHGTWDALLEKTLRAGVLTIMAGEADEWWWRVRWKMKGGIRVLDGDGGLWWRLWRKEVGWERGVGTDSRL